MEPRSYGPYPYEPIIDRPPLRWPGGARIAFWVIPNIEAFALDQPMPDGPGGIPDVSAWGKRDYGNRVGVFRLMEVMERHGVPGTVALNSDICDLAPRIVEECQRLGWELMGHCESNTRRLIDAASEEDAAAMIAKRSTGSRGRRELGPPDGSAQGARRPGEPLTGWSPKACAMSWIGTATISRS